MVFPLRLLPLVLLLPWERHAQQQLRNGRVRLLEYMKIKLVEDYLQ